MQRSTALGTMARTLILALPVVLPGAPAASAGGLVGEWFEGPNARSRLVAGRADVGRPGLSVGQPVAGLEIALAPGWKTYWRNPGDAGGVPPYVTFEGSTNLKSAALLFPAPKRLADPSGEAIGYKSEVVFPIAVTPADTSQPVMLRVRIEYGICREICIPAEGEHALALPAGLAAAPPASLRQAVARVPLPSSGDALPAVVASRRDGTSLEVEIRYPGGAAGADLFAEAPEGAYVPLPKRLATLAPDRLRFVIALGTEQEAAALTGKSLQLTMVGASAASTAALTVP